jgi:opacity protein-like surface antigen
VWTLTIAGHSLTGAFLSPLNREGKEIQMNSFWKLAKAGLFVCMFAELLFSPRASAQVLADMSTSAPQPKEKDNDKDKEASTNDGWHFAITPYIWFAGVHGTTGALGHDASVHATFGDIFNYLNIGAMGDFEARYKRVIMPVDFMWMKLSDNKALPVNDVAQSIQAKMTETLLTPKIGYRIVDAKRIKVDALFGFRYWHLTTDLTLQPVQIRNGFSQSASWADAVAGGRIMLALSPKAFVLVAGDAGGADARSDYQVGGGLGYKVSRKVVLLAGYRYLHVNYRPNGNAQFVYDVNMPGLVLGATFNIK